MAYLQNAFTRGTAQYSVEQTYSNTTRKDRSSENVLLMQQSHHILYISSIKEALKWIWIYKYLENSTHGEQKRHTRKTETVERRHEHEDNNVSNTHPKNDGNSRRVHSPGNRTTIAMTYASTGHSPIYSYGECLVLLFTERHDVQLPIFSLVLSKLRKIYGTSSSAFQCYHYLHF